MKSSRELKGVGVDLMRLSRARQFLKQNGVQSVTRLFSKSEIAALRGKRLTPRTFAKFFSAKEAFFKAGGGSWMGMEGFSGIEVKCLPRDRFKVRSFAGKRVQGKAEGNFLRGRGWIGARLVLWGNEA